MKMVPLFLLLLFLDVCKPGGRPAIVSEEVAFAQPVKVDIKGYTGNIMEPFLSRDGNTLLFNNLNSPPENTNLHWATKINDTNFKYNGEISGLNSNDLEGVPTLDNTGNLYFVSTRNYAATLSTLYQCKFSNGIATNVSLINGVSKLQAGWVNFDIEVSANGQSLYFTDAQFDKTGNPSSADLVIAAKYGTGFQRISNSSEIMKNINTDALEYAACISVNELELYFTRVRIPFSATSSPEILMATRQKITDPFSRPAKISSIKGFAEACTISTDQKTLYYHKKENNRFEVYLVRKK